MTFKEFLESKGISEEDFGKKTPAEMAELHTEFQQKALDDLSELAKGKASPKDVSKAIDELKKTLTDNIDETVKGFVKSDEVKGLKDTLKALKQSLEDAESEITSIKETGKGSKEESDLAKTLKENREKIDELLKTGDKKEMNVTVKAATLTTSITDNTRSMVIPGIGQLPYRKMAIRDVFPVQTLGPDNSGAVTYTDWDEATSARAASMIAEGAVFPESNARWIEKTVKLKKVGDTIPISEEFAYDEARMIGEVERFLQINVALEEESQLYSGDGLAANLEGVVTAAVDYVPVASGLQDANIGDLVLKVSEDLARGKKSKYSANFVIMNLKTINDIWTKKDADNNYIETPFMTLTDGSINIAGLQVIESNLVPDNEMVVGDSRYGTIYEGDSYTLTVGHVDAQFGEDMSTLKARKRMLLLIRDSDKQGFRHVTNITTALATLATAV